MPTKAGHPFELSTSPNTRAGQPAGPGLLFPGKRVSGGSPCPAESAVGGMSWQGKER